MRYHCAVSGSKSRILCEKQTFDFWHFFVSKYQISHFSHKKSLKYFPLHENPRKFLNFLEALIILNSKLAFLDKNSKEYLLLLSINEHVYCSFGGSTSVVYRKILMALYKKIWSRSNQQKTYYE